MSKKETSGERDKQIKIDTKPVSFLVDVPHRPQGADATTAGDYFYVTRTDGLVLFPMSSSPIKLPPIDFYFGANTFLENILEENGTGAIQADDFLSEIVNPTSRLLTWDRSKGAEIGDQYKELLRNAKKVAFISCHGNTYVQEEKKHWVLMGLDVSFGADRVMRAIVKEGYDLVIITSCNPDGLPLAIENEDGLRPAIFRFNYINSFTDVPKNIEFAKVIPPITQ